MEVPGSDYDAILERDEKLRQQRENFRYSIGDLMRLQSESLIETDKKKIEEVSAKEKALRVSVIEEYGAVFPDLVAKLRSGNISETSEVFYKVVRPDPGEPLDTRWS